MPKNKCPREAVTEWTRGSGATICFHFSTTLVRCHVLLLLVFVHSSSANLTNMVNFSLSFRSIVSFNSTIALTFFKFVPVTRSCLVRRLRIIKNIQL